MVDNNINKEIKFQNSVLKDAFLKFSLALLDIIEVHNIKYAKYT